MLKRLRIREKRMLVPMKHETASKLTVQRQFAQVKKFFQKLGKLLSQLEKARDCWKMLILVQCSMHVGERGERT